MDSEELYRERQSYYRRLRNIENNNTCIKYYNAMLKALQTAEEIKKTVPLDDIIYFVKYSSKIAILNMDGKIFPREFNKSLNLLKAKIKVENQ